jgi:hypothetical protein
MERAQEMRWIFAAFRGAREDHRAGGLGLCSGKR